MMRLFRLSLAIVAFILILAGQAQAGSIDLAQVTSTEVTATVQPDSSDIGKKANIWMGAIYGGTLFLRNGASWAPYSGGAYPVAIGNTTLTASMPISVVSGYDVAQMLGLQLYLGYGATESDMLTSPGKMAQIYPAARPASIPMTIRVTVPTNTPAADIIWLRTLNFSRNEEDVKMTKVASGPDVWEASVTAPEGSVFRYWYRRNADGMKRETYPLRSFANGTHYREALVRRNGTFSDSVAQWQDLPIGSNSTGTIKGVVTSSTGTPLMGIRVSAGPHQTMSRWDGSYRVLGVPSGSTEITFRADNGEYYATRTSATVSPTAAVTANVTMVPATMANVTFNVTVPSNTPVGAVPRLFADTYRLGGLEEFEAPTVPYTARVIDMTQGSGNAWSYTVHLHLHAGYATAEFREG